jgi:hypothetical protein
LSTAVIPLDEVARVMISVQKYRDADVELNIIIPEQYVNQDESYDTTLG